MQATKVLPDPVAPSRTRLTACRIQSPPATATTCAATPCSNWPSADSRTETATVVPKRAAPIYPVAMEAARQMDALFDIKRGINGEPALHRLGVRHELSAPLFAELEDWMGNQGATLCSTFHYRHNPAVQLRP